MKKWMITVEAKTLLALFLLLFVPLIVTDNYMLNVCILILIFLISDMGQNIVMGYSGQLSVSGAALMAVGAYTSVILVTSDLPFEISFIFALFFSTLMGVLLGFLTFKVKTHYILIITIGFHEIVTVLINNLISLTGGGSGTPFPSIKLFSFFDLSSRFNFYYFAMVMSLLFLYIAFKVRASSWGLTMMSIRDNEKGALSIGINVVKYRVIAMGFSGLFSGMAGILLGVSTGFLAPGMFSMSKALLLLLVVVLGGMGSNRGLIYASILMTLLSQFLNQFVNISMLIYGFIVVIILLFAPNGIEGLLTNLKQKKTTNHKAEKLAS